MKTETGGWMDNELERLRELLQARLSSPDILQQAGARLSAGSIKRQIDRAAGLKTGNFHATPP